MVTETQLLSNGFSLINDDPEEIFFLSEQGNVAISIEEKNGTPKYEIAIYKDGIDQEGFYSSFPVYIIHKNQSLQINDLIQFKNFVENEPL